MRVRNITSGPLHRGKRRTSRKGAAGVVPKEPHTTQAAGVRGRGFFKDVQDVYDLGGEGRLQRSGSPARRSSVGGSSTGERRVRRVSVAVHQMRRRQSITRQRTTEGDAVLARGSREIKQRDDGQLLEAATRRESLQRAATIGAD